MFEMVLNMSLILNISGSVTLHKIVKFPIKYFVTFTEKILYAKLNFFVQFQE